MICRCAISCLLLSGGLALAAADDGRAADHQALQQLLARATTALNQRDMGTLAQLAQPTFSIVTVDQSRATSIAELKALFDRWFSAEGGIASLTFHPRLDGPAVFLDERTAVATGSSDDAYVLRDGRSTVVPQRWSATVVKTEDGWRLATLHSGVNLMDNPVLTATQAAGSRLALIAAGIAGAVGAVLGWLIGRRRRAV